MCLVLHSGNTYMWKLLQLSDQKKIITQVTHHEVVQNMQRKICILLALPSQFDFYNNR